MCVQLHVGKRGREDASHASQSQNMIKPTMLDTPKLSVALGLR